MAVASLLGGCLAFDSVDYGSGLDRAFTIGYRFLDDKDELWSKRFFRFKTGPTNSVKAGASILGVATPTLLSELNLDGKSVTFVPALGSRETVASEKGRLSIAAQWCANRCGSEFSRDLLSKIAHHSLHGQYRPVHERADILSSAEYTAGVVSTPNVFVLDDFITSGLTLSTIATAIKDKNPGIRVYGMALAKHAYRQSLASANQDSTNDHIPSEWEQIWTRYDKR